MAYQYKEAINVVRDIIQTKLNLKDGQVMFTNEEWKIPKTNGLYIALSYVGPGKTIGIGSQSIPTSGGMSEVQSITKNYLIQIDAMSYDSSARTQKEFIEMALFSNYSQEQQELYIMQIARMTMGWFDASSLEVKKRLNRYIAQLRVTQVLQQSNDIGGDYYSDFSRAVPPAVTLEA